MSSLHSVIRWVCKEADDADLITLHAVLRALADAGGEPTPTAAGLRSYPKVEGKTVTSPVTKRKYKSKAKKDIDAAKILAGKKGPRAKGNTNAEAPDVYQGLKGRVYEALKQTTGKLTSTDLAEILEVKPAQKVSEVLSQGFKTGSIKGLYREAGETTLPTGKVVPTYLYWLDGGLK